MKVLNSKLSRRYMCNVVASLQNQTSPKAFNSIPGPRSVPFLGTAWKYLPIVGNYDFNRLLETGIKKLAEYGNVVKEEVAPGVFFVTVFDPSDIAKVYKTEGKYPERRSHLAVEHYRLSRPHLYNTGGLLPTNGKEWWRLRSSFQKSLSRIQDVRLLLPAADKITEEFLETVIKPGESIEDALPLLSRLNLELTWFAMFGERLHSFDGSQLAHDSVPSQLIEAVETANQCILGTDNTEIFWRRFKTPLYKKLEKSLSFIEKVILESINNKVKKGNHEEEMGNSNTKEFLIEQYLNCQEVDIKDVTGMASDLILGGVDTTSYTSCFILYHLGKNREAQIKLKEESHRLLENENSPVTSTILNNASFTRAVLKETFRLNPISVGVSRIVQEDTVLSGYFVPKGTVVLTQNHIACRLEKNFTQALKFLPERWIKHSPLYKQVSPFLVLPFSHGVRTCIARRLAEQNLLTLIAKVSRKYEILWLGKELNVITPLLNKPDRPVHVLLKSWN